MLLSGERARDLFDERLSVWKEMVRCPDGICILPSFTLLSLSCKVVIFCSTPFVRIDSCNFSSLCEQRLIGQFADDGRWMAFADSFSGWISAWIARELRVTPSLWRASVTWIEFLQKYKLYYSIFTLWRDRCRSEELLAKVYGHVNIQKSSSHKNPFIPLLRWSSTVERPELDLERNVHQTAETKRRWSPFWLICCAQTLVKIYLK